MCGGGGGGYVGGCPSDREMRKVVGEGDRAKK